LCGVQIMANANGLALVKLHAGVRTVDLCSGPGMPDRRNEC
jgi:hypothetical protein